MDEKGLYSEWERKELRVMLEDDFAQLLKIGVQQTSLTHRTIQKYVAARKLNVIGNHGLYDNKIVIPWAELYAPALVGFCLTFVFGAVPTTASKSYTHCLNNWHTNYKDETEYGINAKGVGYVQIPARPLQMINTLRGSAVYSALENLVADRIKLVK